MKYPIIQFIALSDEIRFRIVNILKQSNSYICECELAEILDTPQYNISKHLTILHNAGIIEKRKEGRWTFAYFSKSLDTFMAKILDAFIRIQGEIIKSDIGMVSRINNCNYVGNRNNLNLS